MQKRVIIDYEEYALKSELTKLDLELLEAAQSATKMAYAPYSKFHVGAAARLEDGSIYTGSNQENSSFPVSMCAEQTLFLSLAANKVNFQVSALAVSYNNLVGDNIKPLPPCGKCRQFLSDFEKRNLTPIRVIMGAQGGMVLIVNSISDLMPFTFDLVEFSPEF